MGQLLEPVIYQKLELRRNSPLHRETVSWEIWNDTKNKRLRQRVSMLTQLLVMAGIIVLLQFGIMVKVLLEAPK